MGAGGRRGIAPQRVSRQMRLGHRRKGCMERFGFTQQGIEGWHAVAGRWGVEDMPGAPSGQRVLVQRATENAFNVIVAPSGPYTDLDVSVRFKPMAGRDDASGGIIFRF